MKRDLTRWGRLPVFSSFQDEMERTLDKFFDRETSFGMDWSPDIDISETDNDITVKAEIPGVDPKDIDITVMGDTLTIKGEKKEEKEEKGKSYYRVERSSGSFTRTINLPSQVMADKAVAKGHQGILEITLPKTKKEKTKKITVKTT
jgi:HSP20 family protein